jgi:hypothetical protein
MLFSFGRLNVQILSVMWISSMKALLQAVIDYAVRFVHFGFPPGFLQDLPQKKPSKPLRLLTSPSFDLLSAQDHVEQRFFRKNRWLGSLFSALAIFKIGLAVPMLLFCPGPR